ncbi:MAG: polysaccharide biosynthesis/export family protein [Planctomycetota bacterium]
MVNSQSPTNQHRTLATRLMLLALTVVSFSMTGCTALFSPIDTIPASRVPPQFLAEPQANKVDVDPARLRQPKPDFYMLDSKDVLGVFIEGVLGNFDEAPPVNVPDANSDLPPAIGYPVPVREDGTLSLPLIQPIPVRGLTIQQAETLIQRAYRGGPTPILKEDGRIIVTLLRERTYRVFVVRQDNSFAQRGQQFQGQGQRAQVTDRSDRSSRGFVLQLPAYKNDVLNALLQTGGIPGVNAKPEIRILRGDRLDTARRDQQLAEFYRTNSPDQFPYGQVPRIEDGSNAIKIPLRLKPGQVPNFRDEDIILRDGDVVYIDTRETDVYYTGGLLGGGEFPLPRDYDLDVLQALSLAGNGIATGQRTGLLGGAAQNVPPTELIVLRRIPGDRQLAVRIDLNDAIDDPRQRILVKQGDTLILRFKPQEEAVNFVSNVFFTFGIRELFR